MTCHLESTVWSLVGILSRVLKLLQVVQERQFTAVARSGEELCAPQLFSQSALYGGGKHFLQFHKKVTKLIKLQIHEDSEHQDPTKIGWAGQASIML